MLLQRNKKIEIIVAGDSVMMLDGNLRGEVLFVKGNVATVLFGMMQMKVSLSEIGLINKQLDIKRHNSINYKGVTFESNFDSKLDIRGYKLSDADATLEVFFDKAILNNARNLEIIHGKGKGGFEKIGNKRK